jgi:ribose transport system substrate-binding protein
MEMLVMDTANLEADGTMQLVSAWLDTYKDKLKGLVLAGDGFSMTGALEAVRRAKREDVVIVAAGNSKTGMDAVLQEKALALTYQSAQGDGALALYTAAEWFNGKDIPPVRYLPKHIITAKDAKEYMPAQW